MTHRSSISIGLLAQPKRLDTDQCVPVLDQLKINFHGPPRSSPKTPA